MDPPLLYFYVDIKEIQDDKKWAICSRVSLGSKESDSEVVLFVCLFVFDV